MPDGEHTDYRKAVKAHSDEKIVVFWIIWPDRKTGAIAHDGVFADKRMAEISEMPFDGKRMIMDGFERILRFIKE